MGTPGEHLDGLGVPLDHPPRALRAMIEYFHTGQYVADTSAQAEIFGDVPTVEDTLRRYAAEAGLMATVR